MKKTWKPGTGAKAVSYIYLTILAFIAAFPLYWMVVSAFKSPGELASGSVRLWPEKPTLYYFNRVFNEFGFQRNLLNSLWVALGATGIAIIIASLAAYGIVRYFDRTRKGRVMTRILVLTYMFPTVLLAIPYSVIISGLGLANTKAGLILTYLSFSTPFAVWMLIGFFRTVPREVEEAAMVDGASHLRVFWNIAVPITAPGIVATAIYTFINAWNEFLFSLILTNSTQNMTVSVALYSISGGEILDWGDMMASSVLVILPSVLFFLLIQKKIAGGLAQGSVK